MDDDRLRRVFRQLFKQIRDTQEREAKLLRLYLEILEQNRQLKRRLDEFFRPADPTRPVN